MSWSSGPETETTGPWVDYVRTWGDHILWEASQVRSVVPDDARSHMFIHVYTVVINQSKKVAAATLEVWKYSTPQKKTPRDIEKKNEPQKKSKRRSGRDANRTRDLPQARNHLFDQCEADAIPLDHTPELLTSCHPN